MAKQVIGGQSLYIAERMNKLKPSGIRKVNEKALALEREGKKVIHFEIGRPDFDTPAYIKDAAIRSLENGDVFYTSNFGDMELRKAVAEKLERENHIPCKADNVLITVGLSEAIYDVLHTVLDEGDEILVPDPVWMNYVNVPYLLGAKPVTYHLKEENDWQLDLTEIRALVTPKTRAIVIVSPCNPTGGVLTEETLKGIADIAKQNDLLVLADEVYERIIFDGRKHLSIASLPGMSERTFTLNGASKAFSMTGWRLGYVAAPAEYIKVINKIHQHVTVCAPSFVQKATITALRDEKNEVEDMRKEYERRRDYAVKTINDIPGLSCNNPAGAFYIFINVKGLGVTGDFLAEYLLDTVHIAFVPGSVFGESGTYYMRMSYANSLENIQEGLELLRKAVAGLKK